MFSHVLQRDAAGRPRRRDEHESDMNEDEDTEFGDDYLSDASTDSRRLLKTGGEPCEECVASSVSPIFFSLSLSCRFASSSVTCGLLRRLASKSYTSS